MFSNISPFLYFSITWSLFSLQPIISSSLSSHKKMYDCQFACSYLVSSSVKSIPEFGPRNSDDMTVFLFLYCLLTNSKGLRHLGSLTVSSTRTQQPSANWTHWCIESTSISEEAVHWIVSSKLTPALLIHTRIHKTPLPGTFLCIYVLHSLSYAEEVKSVNIKMWYRTTLQRIMHCALN